MKKITSYLRTKELGVWLVVEPPLRAFTWDGYLPAAISSILFLCGRIMCPVGIYLRS